MLTPSLTLTEQVARQIAADIAQGVHPVGAKLPSGRVLAEQYGVSAAVIREVTERLRAQGLIQSRQGSGCTVTSRTGAQGFLLSDSIAASREQLASVYELRMELEGGAAAGRAAPRRRRPGRHGRLAGEAGAAPRRPGAGRRKRHLVPPGRGRRHNSHYADLLRYLNLQLRQAVGAARQQPPAGRAERCRAPGACGGVRSHPRAGCRRRPPCGRGAPSASRRAIAAGAGGGRAVAHRCPVIDPIRF